MTDETKTSWRFPKSFWSANGAELFERAAYYGVFIGLAVYLSRNYGFSDVGAGWVGAWFSATLYFVPMFAGAWSDRMGFRRALALAFGLLTVGYVLLGAFGMPPVRAALGELGVKAGALLGLSVIIVGGGFVKAVISGTVARASSEANRARAFSIFYMVVNVGAFTGKTIAYPLRVDLGLEYVSFFSAVMALCGLVTVLLLYRGVETAGEGRSFGEILAAFGRVVTNLRFLSLILIVAGFWAIQGQLYAAMPKYVLRMVGEHAKPEWLANVNPFVVVLLVVPVTHLVRRLRPVTSIGIGLLIIPLSALTIALSPVLQAATGDSIRIAAVAFHPTTVALIVGIALQGVAECFLSPRYLEYASRQAPKGEEGLYMGFSHLHTFFAWFVGFVLSGYLLDAFCPDPATLPPEQHAQWLRAMAGGAPLPAAYDQAHYIWYVFAGIGVASFLLLLLFRFVTDRADARARNDRGAAA